MQVELSMRKVGLPGVLIGWELILVDQAGQLGATSKLQSC